MRSILLFYFVALAAPADEFTAKYCETCHNPEAKMGGLSLRGVASYSPVEIWEKVAKRIRAGEMPPAGAPRPEAAALAAYVARIHNTLDSAPAYAGRPVVRRLNRTEYKNAIRDLLALDLPLTGDLPQDPFAAGFDTIADALSMSPLLLERYLKVARRVSELAMGTGDATPVVEIFPAKDTQAAWQGEGMPIGTRGGIRVTHYFPRDGDYDLRAFLVKESLTPAEGVRFFRTRVSKVKAGNHTVIVTFPDEFAEREGPVSNVSGIGGAALGGPLDVLGSAVRPSIDFRVDGKRVKRFEIFGMNAGEAAFDGQPGPPALARIEIAGPYNAASGTESVSRQRILTCRDHTPACVEQILRPLVRRAFRRDVNDDDLRPFLAAARGAADLDSGISAALREILLSPDFLFRLEFDPPGARPDDPREVTPFEFASRLSFFLWSTIPDDALLNAAAAGRVDEGEVRRMLADPKAGALIDNFAAQWLGLPALQEAEPDRQLFPVFDKGLASAFASETRLVVTSLIRENRKLTELIDGGYTYLNDRLAAHYGIPGVLGPGFRRVPLSSESNRGGLLTHGSVLMMTSHSTRTSPVLRGKWILDNLLHSPPPAPPANVPPLDESPAAGRKLTAREQVERHKNNPGCASCHNRIDPLGFALENYDVLGRFRTEDGGAAIDSSTVAPGGTAIRGARGLQAMLTAREDELAHATVERLLTYAVGRELDARDQPAVRAIVRQTKSGGYRFQDLIAAVTQSVPFRMRQKLEP